MARNVKAAAEGADGVPPYAWTPHRNAARSIATDVHLHDTYFVVAHFHYVMMGSTTIAFLGGIHYWWPKMFGRMYSEKWAAIAAGLVFIGFNWTFIPQFVLGSRGMPRRYYNYLDQFQPLHMFSTFGSWIDQR